MKKILSFLLIVLMFSILFSINIYAEDNNDYSVLKTLEIMVGDSNGNMRWDDTVTRAEFTKVATMISSYRKSIALNCDK